MKKEAKMPLGEMAQRSRPGLLLTAKGEILRFEPHIPFLVGRRWAIFAESEFKSVPAVAERAGMVCRNFAGGPGVTPANLPYWRIGGNGRGLIAAMRRTDLDKS